MATDDASHIQNAILATLQSARNQGYVEYSTTTFRAGFNRATSPVIVRSTSTQQQNTSPSKLPSASFGDKPPATSSGDKPPATSYGDKPPATSYGSKPPNTSYGDRPPPTASWDRPPPTAYPPATPFNPRYASPYKGRTKSPDIWIRPGEPGADNHPTPSGRPSFGRREVLRRELIQPTIPYSRGSPSPTHGSSHFNSGTSRGFGHGPPTPSNHSLSGSEVHSRSRSPMQKHYATWNMPMPKDPNTFGSPPQGLGNVNNMVGMGMGNLGNAMHLGYVGNLGNLVNLPNMGSQAAILDWSKQATQANAADGAADAAALGNGMSPGNLAPMVGGSIPGSMPAVSAIGNLGSMTAMGHLGHMAPINHSVASPSSSADSSPSITGLSGFSNLSSQSNFGSINALPDHAPNTLPGLMGGSPPSSIASPYGNRSLSPSQTPGPPSGGQPFTNVRDLMNGAGEGPMALAIPSNNMYGGGGAEYGMAAMPMQPEAHMPPSPPVPSLPGAPMPFYGDTLPGLVGWQRLYGDGTFNAHKSNGMHSGCIDGTVNTGCIIGYHPESQRTTEAVRSGNFTLNFAFKCAVAQHNSGNSPGFMLILQCTGNTNATAITAIRADCTSRCWTLERHCAGQDKGAVREVSDRDLRAGVYGSLQLDVRAGIYLTLAISNRVIFESLDITQLGCPPCSGPLGLGVFRSRLDFQKWRVQPFGARQLRATATSPSHGGVARGNYGNPPPQTANAHTPLLLPPLPGEDPGMVELIERDVVSNDSGISFDSIAALDQAKRLLNEAVTLPLIIPEFFTGIREPWKGVLLFGPPGTGKTLLAKAVAAMNQIRFFNCSAASLTSKWRGESEKLVKVLFRMARQNAPSIVFFDEVDAIASSRGVEGEHEASRRFKSELLTQMDGLASASNMAGRNVIVLAATNCPWDLDDALRRRLEKRIYIALPDFEARRKVLDIHLAGMALDPDVKLDELARHTAGYSGADIKVLCRDASMMPMRRLIADKSLLEIKRLKEEGSLDCSLTMSDFEAALAATQPSVHSEDIARYEQWNKDFAST